MMRGASINAIRTYHVPPAWLLDLADLAGMYVLIDIPWAKHVCFLDSLHIMAETRHRIRQAARQGRGHPSVIGYCIGNEIPPSIVRWHSARRVEAFLAELMDVCKEADPEVLVTYANYPSTEYLDLSFLDFTTFNVYLHDPEAFRRYLLRLQHLVGNKPLVLGEIGMDTLRNGRAAQSRYLTTQVRQTELLGVAGTFVFSWTDEWHTGGQQVTDWAFGLTDHERRPKPSYHALGNVLRHSVTNLLPDTPRVSVVVCSYNGAATLDRCLKSFLELDYCDFEIIVVDDGSVDDTRSILARYPAVRAIHQSNQGLSVARNVGFQSATGEIIAYTDSDCFADRNWLTQIVHQFQSNDASAVGGPNLAPEDGWLAACVAASPGQPMHVLESDAVAEHIPGCNMAFRREALAAINGFDPMYRKAGDDVDVCWRLQQAGHWITFAPGAFVWHHRRQTPRAYLKQQAGYGEAEALLRFKHPAKFNGRGDGKWRGVLYGNSLQGLRFTDALIYGGTFGTGLFQCIYQPAPAHWAMLPATLEWHMVLVAVAMGSLLWSPAWVVCAGMLSMSVVIAMLQSAQAKIPRHHDGFGSRSLIAALCYLQPLVRSWARYRTRMFAYRPPVACHAMRGGCHRHLPLTGTRTIAYWSNAGSGRTAFLAAMVNYLTRHRWAKTIDSGWSPWDLEVYCHPWTVVRLRTAEEDHGSDKRLIRVRYDLRLTGYTRTLFALATASVAAALIWGSWTVVGAGVSSFFLTAALWWRGAVRASQVLKIGDLVATRVKLHECQDNFENAAGNRRSIGCSVMPRHPGQAQRDRQEPALGKTSMPNVADGSEDEAGKGAHRRSRRLLRDAASSINVINPLPSSEP
jgi:GT2 family glycosyltransferase